MGAFVTWKCRPQPHLMWLRCVSSRCTLNPDVSTAVAVYLDYCASAGYVLASTAQTSRPTSAVNGNPGTVTTIPLAIAVGRISSSMPSTTQATEDPASTTSASGSRGVYSISDKIAWGVGMGIGLPS